MRAIMKAIPATGAAPELEGIPPLPVHPIADSMASRRSWSMPALLIVIAAAVAARTWLLWSTSLVPGMNGGYYLVQARALLDHGRLGIPDFPLTFMLQAILAKLLQTVTGRGPEASILLSVKLTDALLPPLAAVPVFLLGRDWCRRAGRGAWPAVVAAAAVILGMPALSMVGDFQKNSLGLVWLAGLIYALYAWMTRRTRRSVLAVLAMLGLTGLTHIGVFGAALLLAALTWGADLALAHRHEFRRHLRTAFAVAVGGAAVAAVVAGLVLWKFDPARIHRLAGAVAHPVEFLRNGGHPAGQGSGGAMPGGPGGGPPGDSFRGARPPPPGGVGGPDRMPRPPGGPGGGPPGGPGGPMGLPGGMRLPFWSTYVAAGAVVLGALVLPFRRRRDLPHADRATALGCAACFVLLTGPWVRGDVDMRLQLIAVVPATFAALYGLVHLPGRWLSPLFAAAALVLMGSRSMQVVPRGGHPIISEDAFAELQTLAAKVTQPGRTLVVARHGLEWWTAWVLHTHVAQSRALSADDWQNYEEVLFIQEKGGPGGNRSPGPAGRRQSARRDDRGMFAGPPGGFGGGPLPGFDGAREFRGPRGFGALPDDFDGPLFSDFGPPDSRGQFAGAGPMRSGGPGVGPPMMDGAIPAGGEVLHDGTYFRLARVREPPAFLESRRNSGFTGRS